MRALVTGAGTKKALTAVDSYAPVEGEQLFVRRWRAQAGQRVPIILLHDSLGSVAQWRDFPAALAQATGREIIAYDRPGFGGSTPREGCPSLNFIEEEARSVFPRLLRALRVDRFALFGHSVGGAMALVIAALHGESCEAVVTESAQAFVEPLTLASIRAAQEQFSKPQQLARLERWHGERAAWVLRAWTGVWLAPQFSSWSLDAWLGQVRCPVLTIHGELDEFGSAAFPRRIVAGVRGPAQLQLLPGCGHVPHRERSAAVLRMVSEFLEQNRTG